MTYLPGTLFLFDTSALARRKHQLVRDIVGQAIDDGVAATCATIDLELGYSGRSADDIDRTSRARADAFVKLPITQAAADRACRVQYLLAQRGLHRAAGVMDLLTAAIAESHRAIIVHYDEDFEHIASVTGQQTRWIVPQGSVS